MVAQASIDYTKFNIFSIAKTGSLIMCSERLALRLALGLLLVSGVNFATRSEAQAADDKAKPKVEILTVTSKSIKEGQSVPKIHTADGKDTSPDLAWTKPPTTAQSVAVTCEDPDAPGGTWFHWIVFNLPATTTNLPENLPKKETLTNGGIQGKNDFGKIGYNGPSPPKGEEHHYNFKVFALDRKLELPPAANKKQFYEALSGHVVGRGKLAGIYKH